MDKFVVAHSDWLFGKRVEISSVWLISLAYFKINDVLQ